jgi:hypothetical protein
VTGGSRRRRPCRWNSFFSCALRARRPENHNEPLATIRTEPCSREAA